jgi:hypothetical protein
MFQIIKTETYIVSYPGLGFRGSAGSPALARTMDWDGTTEPSVQLLTPTGFNIEI